MIRWYCSRASTKGEDLRRAKQVPSLRSCFASRNKRSGREDSLGHNNAFVRLAMNLRETLRQTVATFRANKMRSFLTMFGIIWGISSVIILVGLGKGFSSDQHERMKSLGKDLVIIWGGRTSMQAGGRAAG